MSKTKSTVLLPAAAIEKARRAVFKVALSDKDKAVVAARAELLPDTSVMAGRRLNLSAGGSSEEKKS